MTDNLRHLPIPSGSRIPSREDRDWVTGVELATEAGISYKQSDYWTRTGLLTSMEDPKPGSGYLRRYAQAQVLRARTLRLLLDAGLSLVTCRQVIDEITSSGHVTIGAVTLTLHHQSGDVA